MPRPARLAVMLHTGLLAAALAAAPARAQDPVPAGFARHALGETVALAGGGSITVSDYTADFPATVNASLAGALNGVASAVKAKVCAGSVELAGVVTDVHFGIVRPVRTGHETRPASAVAGIKDPRYNTGLFPAHLGAGTCREGWVVFFVPGATTVLNGATAIVFDNTRLPMVPAAQHARIAWLLK